jgi:hypothetical protein
MKSSSRRAFVGGLAFLVTAALSGTSLRAAEPLPENRALPPAASDELNERARHLLDAIVQGKPELADDFFFPREPFLVLKDVANPARYFDQLIATYHRGVLELHGRRRSWDGATFVSFELGTPPRWVKPGEEWNKIGYHRSYRGRLRYSISGHVRTIDVHTVISWDGRWYVTHLQPIHH